MSVTAVHFSPPAQLTIVITNGMVVGLGFGCSHKCWRTAATFYSIPGKAINASFVDWCSCA
ncbi:hypothetical protein GCM10011591_44620 [Nocardia camponoti]|uniref:Uncharacterized protein n=1 Tax=Nocardia camponoti TaxID=1616106 RepID=A0A917QTP9_9NOCA|nr:hypothetical protein GCM10011591_44620 [Nocardia camponoti]